MTNPNFFSETQKSIVVTLFVFLALASGGILLKIIYTPKLLIQTQIHPSIPTLEKSLRIPTIKIHIAGAVKRPGVYKIPVDFSVLEALSYAGGPLKTANLDKVNLAAHIKAGQRILVPIKKISKSKKTVRTLKKIHIHSLNTSSAKELESLPKIGPTLAKRIIAYRKKHGLFKKIEELSQVKGINSKTISTLRPYCTL